MPIRIYGPSVYPERNAHKSITLWPDAGLVIRKETKKKKSYPDCSTRLFHNFILLFCFSAFLYFFPSLFLKFRCCRVEVIAKSEREEFVTGFN